MRLKRCPYPLCILAEDHDGEDHKFGRPKRPAGELRFTQEFTSRGLHCDLHAERIAEAFYVDSFGFGWALCVGCANEFGMPAASYCVVSIADGKANNKRKGGNAKSNLESKSIRA
jgi:hypothetical protein